MTATSAREARRTASSIKKNNKTPALMVRGQPFDLQEAADGDSTFRMRASWSLPTMPREYVRQGIAGEGFWGWGTPARRVVSLI